MTLREILSFHLFAIGDTDVTVATLVTLTFIALGAFWVSFVLQRALARLLAIGGVTDKGSVGVARRIVHYIVLAVALAVGLETVGISLSALFAAGALFAVGIGFAAQNIFENFASGVILLLERTIKPGDILEVDGEVVEVQSMGFRSTVVRTRNEEDMILPNSLLVQNRVTNYTLRDRLYRLRTSVGVEYGSDMALVIDVLQDCAARLTWRLPDHDPVVMMREFADSAVNFEVSVWVDDPWRVPRQASDLNQAIWWALKEAGIVIAYPQLDVHFDRDAVEAVTRGAAAR